MSSVTTVPLRLPGDQKPEYLSALAAAKLAGCVPGTIRANAVPDAFYVSEKGDKRYPLYTAQTVKAYIASRDARKSGADL